MENHKEAEAFQDRKSHPCSKEDPDVEKNKVQDVEFSNTWKTDSALCNFLQEMNAT